MKPARIAVVDGHRHRQASGYGELVRAILIALSESRHFEVSILPGAPPFEDIGPQRERVANLPVIKSPDKADVILQVGQPGGEWHRYSRPTALYTMFDTSRLPAVELARLRNHRADLLLVPNHYNKRFLDAHFFDVRVVPPILDPVLFRPRRRTRGAAGREYTFLFQGGFGFRKGIDILLEAFTSEFKSGEARLHLHCSNLHIRHANMVLRALAGRPSPPAIELFHKTYHREWMANFYNAADAFVSLTRAEAWGLPITEALLCGRPVVTCRAFGMAEYLPADYAYFVEGEHRLLEDIDSPFGVDWRDRHGEPGAEYFEASVADARAKMRAVVEAPWEADAEADRARAHLLENFGPAHAQRLLIQSLRDLVRGRTSTSPRGTNLRDAPAAVDATTLPRVTALVPCYNAAESLDKTLDCLARQTWPNLEILIADDCSTDTTPRIVEAFAREHPNVRVVSRSQNLGPLESSNDLMANATGELCFFAFHGDLIAPTYVAKLASALLESPSAILAYSHVDVVEADGQHRLSAFEEIRAIEDRARRGLAMVSMPSGWWVPIRGVFRTRAYHEIGGIRTNAAGDDGAAWTWLLSLSLRGAFVCVPEALCSKASKSSNGCELSTREPEQRRALREAGLVEIARSPLSAGEKLVLAAALRLHGFADEARRARQRWKRRGSPTSDRSPPR